MLCETGRVRRVGCIKVRVLGGRLLSLMRRKEKSNNPNRSNLTQKSLPASRSTLFLPIHGCKLRHTALKRAERAKLGMAF